MKLGQVITVAAYRQIQRNIEIRPLRKLGKAVPKVDTRPLDARQIVATEARKIAQLRGH